MTQLTLPPTWDERFATPDHIFGTAPNVFLAGQQAQLAARRGQKALTLADGEGRNGVFMAEQGLDVLALDISPNGLRKAEALARQRGVALRTEVADLVDWRWPDAAFDVVAAIFFQYSDPPERARIFAGLKRTLKPGGLLLMQGYRPEQLGYGTGGPPTAARCYTRALLEKAFADFSRIEIREHDTVLAEGTWHIGRSALIDLVAIK